MSGIDPRGAVVVVTGAGSGIGRAIALRYAKLGAEVVSTDIDATTATNTAEGCRALGAQAHSHACDVTDPAALQDLKAAVGRVDILVNNAGVGVGGPFLDTTDDDWTWLRSINLDAVVAGCRMFGADMVDNRHGQIVNIASGAGYLPNRRMATYCATKSAVVMFSRCLRADWARHDVGVSVVCPGVINTPILHNTRLRGSAVAEKDQLAKIFGLSHSPDAVAKSVTRCSTRNHAMASVGLETHLGYHALRLLPALGELVARV